MMRLPVKTSASLGWGRMVYCLGRWTALSAARLWLNVHTPAFRKVSLGVVKWDNAERQLLYEEDRSSNVHNYRLRSCWTWSATGRWRCRTTTLSTRYQDIKLKLVFHAASTCLSWLSFVWSITTFISLCISFTNLPPSCFWCHFTWLTRVSYRLLILKTHTVL